MDGHSLAPSTPHKPRSDGLTSVARWLGLALVAGVAMLWVVAFAFVSGCEVDCGDNGGRGAFLLIMIASPFALVGAALIAWSVRQDLTTGRRPAGLWRPLTVLVRAALYAGGALATCVAVVLTVGAVDGFVSPPIGNGRPEYGEPVVLALLGGSWTAVAIAAIRSARRTTTVLKMWPRRDVR